MTDTNDTVNTDTKTTNVEPAKDGNVPKDAYEAVSRDMHRFKEESAKLKKQLEDIEADKMKKSGEWQQLAEKVAKERDEYRTKYEGLNSSIINDRKFSSVKDAALSIGLRVEAVEDLEGVSLDELKHEVTSTGRVNVFGAKAMAEALKIKRPHWFSNPGSTNVNGNVPSNNQPTTGKRITEQDVIKASMEAQKTGNYVEYKKLLEDFSKQK